MRGSSYISVPRPISCARVVSTREAPVEGPGTWAEGTGGRVVLLRLKIGRNQRLVLARRHGRKDGDR
jgi:hypothetical protein